MYVCKYVIALHYLYYNTDKTYWFYFYFYILEIIFKNWFTFIITLPLSSTACQCNIKYCFLMYHTSIFIPCVTHCNRRLPLLRAYVEFTSNPGSRQQVWKSSSTCTDLPFPKDKNTMVLPWLERQK